MTDPKLKPPKTLCVTVTGDHVLTVDEVWPDGDAPENPTVEDVIAVMKSCARRADELVRDWDLGYDIEVDGKLVFSI
jgi:hypothetical protein